MESTKEIENRYGEAMVLLLRNKLAPFSATGKTVKSIRYTQVSGAGYERLRIYARPFVKTLEDGRGPRKSSTYGEFDQSILDWMKARGIDKGSDKKNQQFARFLAWKINKEGDQTFKSGGRDLFSGELKILIDSMKKVIIDNKVEEVMAEIKNIFQ